MFSSLKYTNESYFCTWALWVLDVSRNQKPFSGVLATRIIVYFGFCWGPRSMETPLQLPLGSKYQYNEDSEFLYRKLLVWFGPSTHYLRPWTPWVDNKKAEVQGTRASLWDGDDTQNAQPLVFLAGEPQTGTGIFFTYVCMCTYIYIYVHIYI